MTLIAVLARLVLMRLRWLFAGGDSRDAEILALRHQVLVMQRQIERSLRFSHPSWTGPDAAER